MRGLGKRLFYINASGGKPRPGGPAGASGDTRPVSPAVNIVKSIAKWIGIAAAVLAIAWLGFVALIYSKMTSSPAEFGAFMKNMPGLVMLVLPFETLWTRARQGSVKAGDMAPDFSLNLLDKSGPENSAMVRLSSLRGSKPVVLIFGSYT